MRQAWPGPSRFGHDNKTEDSNPQEILSWGFRNRHRSDVVVKNDIIAMGRSDSYEEPLTGRVAMSVSNP